MNRFLLLMGFLILGMSSAMAQFKTMVVNYEKASFGENEPLPSNQNFLISGVVPSNVAYVEVNVYTDKGKDDRPPVYSSFWKKELGNQTQKFNVSINQKLREGKQYDVIIQYYRLISSTERDTLKKFMHQTLSSYINQAVSRTGGDLKLNDSEKKIIEDLNKIIEDGLSQYRSRTMMEFEGLSEVVRVKLKQVNGQKVNRDDKTTAREQEVVKEFKRLVNIELDQYLNRDLHIMVDDLFINDYPTEKVANYLPINVGYGGSIMNSDLDNFTYGAAPYVGLSFPFGKEGSDSKFWSKTSLSLGAYIQNLEDQNGTVYSGPIFKVPTYAALGYRAFRFIRINAGASFLENTSNSNVRVVPFIGVSAEFNVSVTLGK